MKVRPNSELFSYLFYLEFIPHKNSPLEQWRSLWPLQQDHAAPNRLSGAHSLYLSFTADGASDRHQSPLPTSA